MSEQAMWALLRDKAKAHVGMERITEKLNAGVPDVVYQFPRIVPDRSLGSCHDSPGPSGWLELKYMVAPRSWPLVRIPWKSADQPFWLNRWVRWGGRAGVLLYVKDTGWYYWRAWTDITWVELIKRPVLCAGHDTVIKPRVDSDPVPADWHCGPRLDLPGLLAQLRK